jgi:hypothetical protein
VAAWSLGGMHGNTPAGLPRTDGDHSEILGVVCSFVFCSGVRVRGGVQGWDLGTSFWSGLRSTLFRYNLLCKAGLTDDHSIWSHIVLHRQLAQLRWLYK